MNKLIILKNVTISFVKIYQPVPKMSGNGNEFSLQVIMPKDHPQIGELAGAINAIKEEAFPNMQIPKDCLLVRDSDAEGKGQQFDYMENTVFFNVRRNENQGAVPCADNQGKSFVPNPQIIFSGCICNVHISLYDYAVRNQQGQVMKRGVTGSLNGVQLVDNVNVQRLGGGAPVPQFEAVEGNVNMAVTDPSMMPAQDEALPEAPAAAKAEAPEVPW